MQPNNPIVGGIVLRIPAIRSPDFVTGVSGWTINVDGTAEFNNVTVRGTFITGTVPGAHVSITGGQILVFDSTNTLVEQIDSTGIQAIGANGSKIVITPAVASQAQINIFPPTGLPGVTTITPADLLAFGQTPGSVQPVLEIDSPGFNGNGQSTIFLQGESADGTIASLINFQTAALELNAQRARMLVWGETYPLTAAALTLTGVSQPIVFGTSIPGGDNPSGTGVITVTTQKPNARFEVTLWCDIQINTAGDTCVADLLVDGAAVTGLGEAIHGAGAGVTGRATVSQGYTGNLATAGAHTFQATGKRAAGAGATDVFNTIHTRIRVNIFE